MLPLSKTEGKDIWKCILCVLAYVIKVPKTDAKQGHVVNYVLFWNTYLSKVKSLVVTAPVALFSSLSYHIMGNQMGSQAVNWRENN